MNTIPFPTPEEYLPNASQAAPYRVGIIGCGGIVRGAHLPAYEKFRVPVVHLNDIDEGNLTSLSKQYGVARTSTDMAQILEDPEVKLLDVAVPASVRPHIFDQIVAAGKPIFTQKPIAMNWPEACAMVGAAKKANVPLGANQQARWAPAHKAIKILLERGAIGELYSIQHLRRGNQDNGWYAELENFNLVDHGVHYFDLARYWSGEEPIAVQASTVTLPKQTAVSPLYYTAALHFKEERGLMGVLNFNNIVQVGGAAFGNTWWLDGSEGSIMLGQYPGGAEYIEYFPRKTPGQSVKHHISGKWFFDAFGGSMRAFQDALANGEPIPCSGEDHLRSIRLCMTAVESYKRGEKVAVDWLKLP